VGAADVDGDDIPFPERFKALQEELDHEFRRADELAAQIRLSLQQVVES
jgi:hypothetical protein